jgi:sugar phosphate isomerase/epimerase
MNLLLHTIAFEPARWTPRRVSRPLLELLPAIAAAGFRELEIYEPHLGVEAESSGIRDAFAGLGLVPVILSSYLNLNPAQTADGALDEEIAKLAQRIAFYGFRKVRLFPGPGMKPADEGAPGIFMERIHRLLKRLPPVEVLLETHDGSLADDPALLARLMGQLPSNVGLLYQPTFFTRQSALDQFHLQKPFIRHLHLQNRHPDFSFARLREGVIPWPEIIADISDKADATVEFVPEGICPEETFDLQATLGQAREETDYVRTLFS